MNGDPLNIATFCTVSTDTDPAGYDPEHLAYQPGTSTDEACEFEFVEAGEYTCEILNVLDEVSNGLSYVICVTKM